MAMLDLSDPQTLPGTTVPCSELFRAREAADAPARPATLVDPFGRAITYLRISVTDRCDFRCAYCSSFRMPMICSSLNRLFFIVRLLFDGL